MTQVIVRTHCCNSENQGHFGKLLLFNNGIEVILKHIVATMGTEVNVCSDHSIATMTLGTIVAFDTIVAVIAFE
jgi:hypothetical protein